jgi:hypothetical protein
MLNTPFHYRLGIIVTDFFGALSRDGNKNGGQDFLTARFN